jgi:hypothetical protein
MSMFEVQSFVIQVKSQSKNLSIIIAVFLKKQQQQTTFSLHSYQYPRFSYFE